MATVSTTFLRDVNHGGPADQPRRIAQLVADYASAATRTLDVAMYDFRLSDALALIVVPALTAAAARGVVVRIGYDGGSSVAALTQAEFSARGADPAPPGTAGFLTTAFGGTSVELRAIKAGSQLMHSKYLVRDAEAVWTGSTNFTDDAWTLQENNILIVSEPTIAAGYAADFEQMWTAGSIAGTGKGDAGTATPSLGETAVWDFSPGDGAAIDAAIVALISAATVRIVIASMVLTSPTVLAARHAAISRGVPVSGIYDSGQMAPIVATWREKASDATELADFEAVSAVLAAKQSAPYSPTSTHDFMHDKVLVADDQVATGSYNFSRNAEKNAENQIRLTDAALADSYAAYITTIAAVYGG